MQQPTRIAPSILSADFARLGEDVRALAEAGADAIHIDVMDGHYVPNLTIGPAVVKALRGITALPFDTHLMITPAQPFIGAFAAAGADTITVHPEADHHPHRTIKAIREAGRRPGVALNPATPVAAVEELVHAVDLILVMTVDPGFGGQAFLASQLDKIARVRALIDRSGRKVDLEVDGGITPETARLAVAAGADLLVAGTAIFSGGPPAWRRNIAALRG
jgi:ribulose-phosphate 3-epimerase